MGVIIPVPTEEGLRARYKPGNVQCPHLSYDEHLQASCAVHELPEYQGSPCWTYGNPDVDPDFILREGKPCRVGEMFRRDKPNHAAEFETTTVGELEDLGPWPEEQDEEHDD